MKLADVAQAYANEHGLECSIEGGKLANQTIWLTGNIGGGSPGAITSQFLGRPGRRTFALYRQHLWTDVIGGLWVHRSGRSIWTREPLPKRYREIQVPDEAFTAHYRIGVLSDTDDAPARRVLTPHVIEAYNRAAADHPKETWLGAVELKEGRLRVQGAMDSFSGVSKLDEFATLAATIAAAALSILEPTDDAPA